MWAGGELEFFMPLTIGDKIERKSRVTAIDLKEGRSGRLCFVSVEHSVSTARGTAIKERQDIVYRAAAQPGEAAAPAAPSNIAPAEHSMSIRPDPVMLFRYSALTFNGHRIHYDRDYATQVEHYPALVVQGPLQATLLAEFGAELAGGTCPRKFQFRGLAPLFDSKPITVKALTSGQERDLWIEDDLGRVTMKAKASWT
jgi:3-methylfumaryl-CoA hydratase